MNKIGRNEPCPCGSGKKYKQCCVELTEAQLSSLQKVDPAWRELFRKIEIGYAVTQQNRASNAIDAWNQAWKLIWQEVDKHPKIKSLRELDEKLMPETSIEVFVQDWAEMMYAVLEAKDAPTDSIKENATQFLQRLNGSSSLIRQNVMKLLAETHVRCGDNKAAVDLFKTYEKQFAAELDEEELQELHQRMTEIGGDVKKKRTKAATATVDK